MSKTKLKTPKDYQDYFEKVFAKTVIDTIKAISDDEEYTEEDVRVETTYYFLNESTDYDAVAGMYIGYAGGNADRALQDFKDEIVDEPSERDRKVIEKLEQIIALQNKKGN